MKNLKLTILSLLLLIPIFNSNGKPDEAKTYLIKGMHLLDQKKLNEAIDSFDLAIKYKPDFLEAYICKIKILRYLGKNKEADKVSNSAKNIIPL